MSNKVNKPKNCFLCETRITYDDMFTAFLNNELFTMCNRKDICEIHEGWIKEMEEEDIEEERKRRKFEDEHCDDEYWNNNGNN